MDRFLETFLIAVEAGAIYSSLALAIVIVYRTSRLLNFAQGEMAMFSTFLVWQFTEWGLPIWGAIVAGLVVSFVMGALIERLLIRPVGNASSNPLAVVIVTIGLFLALNGLAGYLWGRQGDTLPNPFPDDFWEIAGVRVNAVTIGCLVVLLAEVVFLMLLFQRTKLGLALRAVASNEESSRLVGVPVGWMLMAGWGLAAAIGAMAGVLAVAAVPSHAFDPNFMVGTLVFAFAAATLGGFDSVIGAVVGGMIVALVEKFSAQYIDAVGTDLAVGSAFVLIIVVLLVRPQGLFGTAEVTRV
jgi:branched-chain amino acid transport system permease protein